MDKTKYKWGIGIEHELHLFHIPDNLEKIEHFIIYDSESAVNRILSNYEKKNLYLNKSDYNFLKSIPFELSGRLCNGHKVINKPPINMPELITSYPFCSVNRKRISQAIDDINNYKIKFLNLLKKDEITNILIKKHGRIDEYPFGMSRYIKYGKVDINNNYVLNKNKYTDYTGSYHITLTLPYTVKTTDKEFIKMHQNFCNQIQWIEPLLLISFFSGDEYAPGTKKDRLRGSFRMGNVGWGNIAGSDIRLFNEGIGRYAKKEIFWRKDFKFEDYEKLKPCIKPSPYAKKEGGITSYGTDFRTFGNNNDGERVSGFPMKKPNGIEIRIFDNFSTTMLKSLLMFLFLLMQNSFTTHTTSYVYENKIWIEQMQNIMRYGYTAKINQKYINLIENKLDLNIIKSDKLNIYNSLLKSLYYKNKNGFYFSMLIQLEKNFKISICYMNINQKSWELAFLIKLNKNKNTLIRFNQFLKILEYLNKISYFNIKKLILFSIGDNWTLDIENILIFLKEINFINYKNLNNEKNIIKIVKKEIIQIDNRIITIFIDHLINNELYSSDNIKLLTSIENNNNNI